MKQKRKFLKIISGVCKVLLVVMLIGLVFPTWTPKIEGENSISELRKVEVNGEKLQIMIRGCDKDNPIILFVHGGPCWPEIPYVVKYQKEWEEKFTIVHYDQWGSGKSYQFFKDYSNISAKQHVEDLIALTEYIVDYLEQEQVILIGHSYGTYIATMAAAQRPDLFRAYVGIGQVSNKCESELDSLNKCILAAENEGNTKDVTYLESLMDSVKSGEKSTPRKYVRKYGFAAKNIDDNMDYLEGFLLRPEYNLLDTIRLYTATILYQDILLEESANNPVSELVTEIDVPVYFLMGKYDGMTSPEAAKRYLDNLQCPQGKEFVLFEDSAHFPQSEERELFFEWLNETFGENLPPVGVQ